MPSFFYGEDLEGVSSLGGSAVINPSGMSSAFPHRTLMGVEVGGGNGGRACSVSSLAGSSHHNRQVSSSAPSASLDIEGLVRQELYKEQECMRDRRKKDVHNMSKDVARSSILQLYLLFLHCLN